jgi:hypothetical protein
MSFVLKYKPLPSRNGFLISRKEKGIKNEMNKCRHQSIYAYLRQTQPANPTQPQTA